jgi:hypothetical protein
MRIYYKKKNILLAIGIFIFFSYLFQIYWIDNIKVMNSVIYITSGSLQRNLIKLFGILLVYATVFRAFSFQSFKYNFTLKIPLLYYLLTVVLIVPLFFSSNYIHAGAHLMALNLVIFTPILFINFSDEIGNELFLKIIKIVVWVVCIQLLLDLLIKLLDYNYVGTILGGMGNANTFGMHLIIAALGLRFIYNKFWLSNIVLLFTFGTASLSCSLIGLILIFDSFLSNIFGKKFFKTFFIILALLATSPLWLESIINILLNELSGPLEHVFAKFIGFFSDLENLGSVRGRLKWIYEGMELMYNNPLSIIFGHPNFLPFFTGDGFYMTLLVTLGLPALIFFILSHIYVIKLGMKEKTSLSKFSTYTLIIYMYFFTTNRILDYWPSGFVYMLVFAYLTRKIINYKK